MSGDVLNKALRGVRKGGRLLYLTLRSLGMDRHGIKKFYICNVDLKGKAVPYRDSLEAASTYQYSVYVFARRLIVERGLGSVLDIGCGAGVKLAEVIYPVCQDITGIDVAPCIEACRRRHAVGAWRTDDVEHPGLDLGRRFDLIIASDVIEHLVNPDALLAYIERFAHEKTLIVISTPERDLVRGKWHFGPAPNTTHVREWNRAEFSRYVGRRGFEILDHFLTDSAKNAADNKTQVVLCRVKKTPAARA